MIDKAKAATLYGHNFYFDDIVLSVYRDVWGKCFVVQVWRPGKVDYTNESMESDRKIAGFSFENLDDAVEIAEHALTKIVLAEALFGWLR